MNTNVPLRSFFLAIVLAASIGHAQYKTLGPGGCGSDQAQCHVSEHKNMVDKHKNSVDDLSSNDDAKKYSSFYGIAPAAFLKGTSKCWECHATVVSGKEASEVEDGVSCESCHGPGSGYRDPHKEKGAYQKALALGMTDLKNLKVRSATCVRCHLTTDQKILASGHPDGLKFNYVNNMKSVAKHWKRPLADEDKNRKYFDDAVAARGPVPKTIAPPPEVAKAKVVQPPDDGAPIVSRKIVQPRPAPVMPAPVTPVPLTLEPFPALNDTMSVDQILLVVKKRLDLLYRKTSPSTQK